MVAGPNDLTTLTNALAWLGCQSDDAFGSIQRIITAVSTMIQGHLGRTVAQTAYTFTFDGRGRHRVMMPNWPIVSVQSLNIVLGAAGTMNVPARSQGVPGYTFSDKFIYMDPPYMFERGQQNIQIAYTAGYATTPPDIEQACLIWIKAIMDGANYSAAIAKAKAGQTALDFSFATTKLTANSAPMPPSVYSLLVNYMKVTPSW